MILVNSRYKTIAIEGETYPCRIGRGGFSPSKREGDEKTPLGEFEFRFGLYRSDRLPGPPPSQITFRAMEVDDGWCDDPNDPAYNRFIRLPLKASHEKIWREDGVYDIILVINQNDSPPIPAQGSAVFFHIAHIDERQTLGCVALSPDVMVKLLLSIKTGTKVRIQ